MEIIPRICCGIDVHAKTVVVCLSKDGKKQIRAYSTMTDDWLALCDWLVSEGTWRSRAPVCIGRIRCPSRSLSTTIATQESDTTHANPNLFDCGNPAWQKRTSAAARNHVNLCVSNSYAE